MAKEESSVLCPLDDHTKDQQREHVTSLLLNDSSPMNEEYLCKTLSTLRRARLRYKSNLVYYKETAQNNTLPVICP